MENVPYHNPSDQTRPDGYSFPWSVPEPRLATYIMLFFLVVAWPSINLLLLIPGQYEINYDVMDPVMFIFLPTMIIEWFIVFCIGLVLWREKANHNTVGLVGLKAVDFPISIGAFFFLNIFFALLQMLLVHYGFPFNDSVNIMVEKGNGLEGWWWAISITAAFCEEITFRGFLITRLRAVTRGGWLLPLFISSVAFGCGHSYQGLGGFVLLTLLGMMLGGLFLWRRSLWPVILVHFIIDISAIYIYRFSESSGL